MSKMIITKQKYSFFFEAFSFFIFSIPILGPCFAIVMIKDIEKDFFKVEKEEVVEMRKVSK